MTLSRTLLTLVATTTMLFSNISHAHLLKVFAYLEGNTAYGHVYFAGGDATTNATVALIDDSAQVVDETTTDEKGEFTFTLSQNGHFSVVATTPEGHQANWKINNTSNKVLVPTDTKLSNGSAKQNDMPISHGHGHGHEHKNSTPKKTVTTPYEQTQLIALVEQVVAKQIGPLRQELQQAHSHARFSDIIGGIGFIFGIFGIVMWLRHRQ